MPADGVPPRINGSPPPAAGGGGGAPAGGEAPEPGTAPVISEVEVGRLMAGLEHLHADYEETLAAGRRAAERLAAEAQAASDGEESDGPHDASMQGYVALGSDDDSDGDAGSDAEGATDATGGPDCSASGLQQRAAGGDSGTGQGDASVVLEDFADFSERNLSLPPPPAAPPQLAAAPLTSDDVTLIKQTMQKVSLPPPRWAENLSDDKLEDMVRDLVRST
mmetsp:Transcript_51165/g.158516  ORF Transcript_51165/g.158516 Transcript_51165/m.158516 type:complete len:221 (-) Transcript_51165:25-687(-)